MHSSDDGVGSSVPESRAAMEQRYLEKAEHFMGSHGDAQDGDDDDDYDDSYAEQEGRPYVPPASVSDGSKPCFATNIEKHFVVPARLQDKPYELIEAANDWHYAMMNDHPRNEFYKAALARVVKPDSVVLEIGAGSGLLSIIAASLGAQTVVAIEANHHLANVAREIIRRNGYEGKIHIINKMSTEVTPAELEPFGTPTVLLSEILGTLLLGESALHYVMDARQRLTTPDCAVVPLRGTQFATLVDSADIASITSVKDWQGIDLSWFNSLQDTTSMVFTKQYGFRFSSCSYTELAPRLPVLPIDFSSDQVGVWRGEKRTHLQVQKAGTIHAILASWEVYAIGDSTDKPLVMATHPDATLNNFPRDMQWGQGLQLIEDMACEGGSPVPFQVSAGEWLTLVTRFSIDGVTMQFQLERADPSPLPH
mmetsp:Transcript_34611/g.73910  ORF Transcript_34611/g.73910 Transcript_34611/m.73910 type:complete len:423 (-) Transcript_34611:61-1329(-)